MALNPLLLQSSPFPAKLLRGVGINGVSPNMDVRLASVGTGTLPSEAIAIYP